MKTLRKLMPVLLLLITTFTYGQRFITKTGHIWFHSEAPLETIEAHNKQVNSALDVQTGDFVFKVLMKSFIFEKALMQEHFNENYVESDKYPNATFKGKVTDLSGVEFNEPGTYTTEVHGELSIHGISKTITSTGTFDVKPDMIHGKSTFSILIDDYNISIPGAVAGKIAEEIDIHVDVKLKELKK